MSVPATAPDKPVESLDDIELIQRIGVGDRECFEEFYNRHSSLVYSTAYKVLNNADDAEDVTQDVMFMVWEKSPMYEEARGKPLSWAITMTRNKAIDRLRSVQRRLRLKDDVEKETLPLQRGGLEERPADLLDAGETRQLVRSAVMKLNREQREVIEMAYFGGLTQQEISQRLKTPLGTVKARIRRGMLRLRKMVGRSL
jgi:RNA polymerase sigma-70 factor, ECF subfamily